MRHEAQNALLKSIEEPPRDTLIIATFSNRNRVLHTIHSRMQQISVLPVSLAAAKEALASGFSEESINKAYYMSGGQAGLMSALLNDLEGHELVAAISEARKIIEMPRYERLSLVDKLVKDKNRRPELLLDGLYRLVSAAYRAALESPAVKSREDFKAYAARLGLLEQSISDLQENVHPKLVFSRLFMEL